MTTYFKAWAEIKDPQADKHFQFLVQLDPSVTMTSATVEEVDDSSTVVVTGSDLTIYPATFSPESGGDPGWWIVDFRCSGGSPNPNGSSKEYYARLTFTTDGPVATDQRTGRLRVAQR